MTAARQLFSLHGFHNAAVSELAAAANVSVGQIYRLFRDKKDVILAIVIEDTESQAFIADEILNRVKTQAVSVREAFVQLVIGALSTTEESLSFEILAEANRNADVAQRIGDFCVRYRATVRNLATIANPGLSDNRLDGAEEVLLGLMFGLGHRGLSRSRLPTTETAEQTAGIIMAALANAEYAES